METVLEVKDNVNFKDVVEFVEEVRKDENYAEHKEFCLTFRLSLNGEFIEEVTDKVRLGISNAKVLLVMKKRSTKYGYPLETMRYYTKLGRYVNQELIKVEWKAPKKRKSEEEKFATGLDKVLRHLNESHLWHDLRAEALLMKTVGKEKSKEFHDKWLKHNLTDEEKKKDYEYIAKVVESTGDDNLTNRFNYLTTEIGLDLETEVKYSNCYSMFNDYYVLEEPKIVKMKFHKDSYAKGYTDMCYEKIKKAIEIGENCSFSSDNGYDVTFNYRASENKAWYSCEYRGCGNGHYYLALNNTHALFYEND